MDVSEATIRIAIEPFDGGKYQYLVIATRRPGVRAVWGQYADLPAARVGEAAARAYYRDTVVDVLP